MNSDLFSLDGRIALVTGASSGIGRVLALGLAKAGARIVAVARRADRLDDLFCEIERQGGVALAAQADVTDVDSIERAFDMAEQAFGTVDVVVSNAGVTDARNFLKILRLSPDIAVIGSRARSQEMPDSCSALLGSARGRSLRV